MDISVGTNIDDLVSITKKGAKEGKLE